MNDSGKMILRLALFGGLVVLTALLGLLVGEWSVPKEVPVRVAEIAPSPRSPAGDPVRTNQQAEEELLASPTSATPPLYFSLAPDAEGNWDNALQQVALAANAGVHRYVVPVQFHWYGNDRIGDALDIPRAILEVDAQASLLLKLDLNPDDSWIQENAEAVVGEKFPRPASRLWLEAVQSNLEALQGAVADTNLSEQIAGYILTAFEDGEW
jgi:hypothetical protein